MLVVLDLGPIVQVGLLDLGLIIQVVVLVLGHNFGGGPGFGPQDPSNAPGFMPQNFGGGGPGLDLSP